MNKTKLYSVVFKLLIGIILLNLNGLIFLFVGSTGIISPLILIFSAYVILNSKSRAISNLSTGYFIYILLYLVIGSISLLISFQVGVETLTTMTDIIKSIVLIYAVYLGYLQELQKSNSIIVYTCWLIIFSVVLSYGLDYLNIASIQANYRTDYRMSGFFANPNELAAQSLFSIISIQYLFKKYTSKYYRLILMVALLISGYAMFMAFSRSIFLVLFIILFLQVFLYKGLSFKSLILLGGFALLLVVALPLLYENTNLSLQKRIDTSLDIFDEGLSDGNTGGRFDLISEAFVYINENPFLGVGIGNMQRMEGVGGVHNAYLAVWGNAGFFVLLYFISFLIRLIKELHIYTKKTGNTLFLFLILTICINGLSKAGVFEFKINNLIMALTFAVLANRCNNIEVNNNV
ncbi:O-antigen ligase family protein [uncultured Nonlabens sp.]|uniref:O-antigen ligase family protein n=1 Tax=uncultured Nonlabens sp. TaxID=859306 RepID=UPI0030DAE717|tara:strand:- start:1062 stop:2276 length:1215 start_codon:yes stop_codon:yes gene_type:complete